MPTPRMHGGAAVAQFPLTVPGFRGLNTQQRGALLGPEWATRLENTVIDSSGRVSARKGWNNVTSSAHGNPFISGIEYRKKDGTTNIVLTTDTEVLLSTNSGNTFSNITDSASFTSGNWFLVNFDDYVVGFQDGETPLYTDGSTTNQMSDPNAPTGGVGTAAFGRLWCVDSDGVTIKYTDLLDLTDWTNGGSIDMSSIWLDNDHVVGLTAFNNLFIVFGSRNIVVWADNTGSELGIDPTQMEVVDTIPGVGLLSQHSIQHINGDLWFVADNLELMSFSRVVVEQKSGNITTLSKHVSDFLRDTIASGSFDIDRLRSAFSSRDRFYLLSLPVESAPGQGDEIGKVFVFDTRAFLEDGSARCIGVWNQLVPTVIITRVNDTWLSALQTKTGELGAYATQQDDGESYRMIYESGWIDITQQGYQLILKRINGLFFFDLTTTVLMKWAFDFSTIFYQKQLQWETTGGNAVWGSSEWGVAEWGGGIDLSDKKVAGKGTGEYIKVGMEATINGGTFSIQQIDLLAKVGRLKG